MVKKPGLIQSASCTSAPKQLVVDLLNIDRYMPVFDEYQMRKKMKNPDDFCLKIEDIDSDISHLKNEAISVMDRGLSPR